MIPIEDLTDVTLAIEDKEDEEDDVSPVAMFEHDVCWFAVYNSFSITHVRHYIFSPSKI